MQEEVTKAKPSKITSGRNVSSSVSPIRSTEHRISSLQNIFTVLMLPKFQWKQEGKTHVSLCSDREEEVLLRVLSTQKLFGGKLENSTKKLLPARASFLHADHHTRCPSFNLRGFCNTFPRKKGTDANSYLGSLLNLCVTTADFPLHFSQEYSISSACVRTEKWVVEEKMHQIDLSRKDFAFSSHRSSSRQQPR